MIVGIGVDIVEIGRIRRLRERQGEAFLEKCFTPAEREYCRRRKNADESFAARFAAKEAVMKALGTGWSGGASFAGIEVVRDDDGPPTVQLHGKTAALAESKGVLALHLSLSHSERYAVAQVVAEGEG